MKNRMPALGTRVLWSATVDPIEEDRPVPLRAVTVWSEEPFAHRRVYDIEAHSDDEAVNKAAEQFIEEVENLID
jgi:hypothetical protein